MSIDMSQPGAAVQRLADMWDGVVERFLDGGPAVPPDLDQWSQSYSGRGTGEVVWDAFAEPYLGPLDQTPAAVFLALNPGRAYLDFQSRDGVFADEIRRLGSYRAWAATWPYLRDPWVTQVGPNRHHRSRLLFMRRWFDEQLPAEAMVGFELYPWHSTNVTGQMRPDPETLRRWVWEPIADLDAPVFAFGGPWFPILDDDPNFEVVDRLGKGGRPYPTMVESRVVSIYRGHTGLTVLAERHSGSAGPPSAVETEVLRHEVTGWFER